MTFGHRFPFHIFRRSAPQHNFHAHSGTTTHERQRKVPMSKKIIYKGTPATIESEITRINPTKDASGRIVAPGKIFARLNVAGAEVWDWISYEELYDLAG